MKGVANCLSFPSVEAICHTPPRVIEISSQQVLAEARETDSPSRSSRDDFLAALEVFRMKEHIALSLVGAILCASAHARGAEPGEADTRAALDASELSVQSVDEARPRPHRLEFGPQYRRFGWWDVASTVIFAGMYFPLEFFVSSPDEPKWASPILFDEPVRDALVAKSPDGIQRAHFASDAFWLATSAFPVADAIITPLVTDRWNFDVAAQLTAINLHSMAINGFVSRVAHATIGRQRPDVDECQVDETYSWGCYKGSNASFPSGHTSSAMTGAALTCAHHTELRLYGSVAADVATCVTVAAAATTGGVLRVVADRHFATDVVAGAALGWSAGFLIPKLLYYRFYRRPRVAGTLPPPFVTPFYSRGGAGLVASGLF